MMTSEEMAWPTEHTPIGDAAQAATSLATSAEIAALHERLDAIDADLNVVMDFLVKASPLLATGLKYIGGSKTDKVRAALGLRNV